MKYHHALSSTLIGVSIVLVQPQVTNAALSTEQLGEIAQGITVLIETTDKKDNGSGVIIQKQGDSYTVLTAAHVVKSSNQKYEIVTPDKQRYQLDRSKVKKLPNQIDLAVVTFTSNKDYQVAKVGNPDKAKLGTTVYVAGFPKKTASRKFSSINFPPPGQITANATQAVDGGYSLSYNIATLPGMSGGPLLNQQGELIAIHGRGEPANVDDIVYEKLNPEIVYVKGNNNYAIPIYTFVRQASLVGVNLGITAPPLQVAQAPTAENFFLKGVDKAEKKDYQGAINDFNQAIKINPQYAEAYYNRGNARTQLQDYQEAINDFNQAIKINPEYADAYLSKRDAHNNLSPTARKIANQTQAMLAEQRAFQLLMQKIKNDDTLRQKFIMELRRQAEENKKNSFN
ncbi:MAG: trypsin-like peptidase domain-containing protein [Cyanobacteria bacterium P01_C01_bin.38]